MTVPTLVVQGDNDPFGMPPAAAKREVVTVPGNHSLTGDLATLRGRSTASWERSSASRGRPRARISPVAPGDVQSAFAAAAAQDGIVLESGSFDWLCEQGHVGLERVAKARRDPAIVAPVIAALEQLRRSTRG